jgi:uncharacterized protein (DUF58 family)
MIPTLRLIQLMATWFLLGLLCAFFNEITSLWIAAGLLLASVALLDAIAIWRSPPLAAQRQVPSALPLLEWVEIDLRVHNLGRQPITVEVFDAVPASFEQKGMPILVKAPADGWVQTQYRIKPNQRGDYGWQGIYSRRLSSLGLWHRTQFISSPSEARVYPNFADVTRYHVLAAERRAVSLGIRRNRRRGEGQDFHQLREYRAGDALRQIDWKATARHHRLISKDYQEERDQQIVFLLDCGRKMRAQSDGISHFDHALNAILLLCYISVRQGDAVGLMAFGGDSPRWLAPNKGMGTVNRILNAVYNLQTTPRATDYLGAATDLATRLTKRALVILVTNIRDEDIDDLKPALHLLRERHLPLVASLREYSLEQALATPIHNFGDALQHAALCDYLEHRQQAHQQLRDSGHLSLDVLPHLFAGSLVSAYYDIKFSGRL